jgi:hypothetical protein
VRAEPSGFEYIGIADRTPKVRATQQVSTTPR